MLLAPGNSRFYTLVAEDFRQPRLEFAQDMTLITFRLAQCAFEHAVPKRPIRAEAEILQFDLEAIDSEPIGDRRVNLQGLLRDPPLLLQWQRRNRAHIVCPVGELDEDNAQVPNHREQHFSEALRLSFRGAVETQSIELADTVDEQRDILAEPLPDLIDGARRVLDHVV